jgi:hypothetical protein
MQPDWLKQVLASWRQHRGSKTAIWSSAPSITPAQNCATRQAREIIVLTLHLDFKNSGAARSWWQRNQSAFDDDLVINDPQRFIRP